MTHLLVDWSPVAYGNLFGATSMIEKTTSLKKEIKTDEDGKYNLDQYKDIVIHKIIDELSKLRTQFDLKDEDQIIICTDTPGPEGYWRKDVWAGYKSKRKDDRDKSKIQWDKAFTLFNEILDLLDECSSYKVIRTPRTEGDDIIFVLTEYFSGQDQEVIIFSQDHDFIQCLINPGVKFWRTTRTTGMENSSFYEATSEELTDAISDHVIGGDSGDGFYHIKSYSKFSPEFEEKYPKYIGKELNFYKNRFQLDQKFKEQTGGSAYKHPRFGYKSFKKSKKNLDDILNENTIYQMNYQMNQDLALPERIPDYIRTNILTDYEKANGIPDYSCLTKFFTDQGLIELIGNITLL